MTNANGAQTVETLGDAGVASIDLTENNHTETFSDGSSIDGETTFKRVNGTTGTAAYVTFVSEALAYSLQTTKTIEAGTAMRLAA